MWACRMVARFASRATPRPLSTPRAGLRKPTRTSALQVPSGSSVRASAISHNTVRPILSGRSRSAQSRTTQSRPASRGPRLLTHGKADVDIRSGGAIGGARKSEPRRPLVVLGVELRDVDAETQMPVSLGTEILRLRSDVKAVLEYVLTDTPAKGEAGGIAGGDRRQQHACSDHRLRRLLRPEFGGETQAEVSAL